MRITEFPHRRAFLSALSLLTRIPVRQEYRPEDFSVATYYYPIVGLLVGTLCAMILMISAHSLPWTTALLVSTASGLWLTGALHEDGLADAADGFGGGYNRQRALEIMKDSQLGTYGVCALIFVLALKLSILHALSLPMAVTALLVAHSISRALAVSLQYQSHYVQLEGRGKSQPDASPMTQTSFIWLIGSSYLVAVLGFGWLNGSLIMLSAITVRYGWQRYLHYRIQGYTGDTLGAGQQLIELGCYLCIGLFM